MPARFGDALIRCLLDFGKEFDAIGYGTDALGVMRIEKGHVGGPEMNGTTTAKDLGLGRMMSRRRTLSVASYLNVLRSPRTIDRPLSAFDQPNEAPA